MRFAAQKRILRPLFLNLKFLQLGPILLPLKPTSPPQSSP
jgi:hypothetical protein